MSGSLCLDFVNTVGGREGASILRDKLAALEDVAEWSHAAGLLSAAEAANCERRGETFLKRALGLREAIYAVAKSVLGAAAPSPANLGILNREMEAAATRRRLTFENGKLVRGWSGANPLDRVLWTVADSASALFTSPDAAAIRQCPGDECGWLFLDTSRNHSRRWCEMRICGNRTKVRRFRENS